MEGCEPFEPCNSPKSSQEARWPGRAIKYEGESQIRLLVSDKSGQNTFSCLDEDAFSLAVGSGPSLVWVKKKKKKKLTVTLSVEGGTERGAQRGFSQEEKRA